MRKYLSKRNILIIVAILFIVVILAYRHTANNISYHSAENVLKQHQQKKESFKTNLKIFIKETVFVFRNQELLKQEILENPLFAKVRGRKIDTTQQWSAVYLKQNKQNIIFQKIKTTQKTINDTEYQLNYFSSKTFTDALDKYAASAYLHYDDNQLFFITAAGILGNIDLTNQTINDNQLNAYTIASNLDEFTDPNFDNYDNNIRDLFIKNGKIYVSINIAFNSECYGTVLLAGKLNTTKIEFKQIFSPDGCNQTYFKNQKTKDFSIDYSMSGGRIVDYKDGKLLLSTGDAKQNAQGDNTHGKIFAIDEKTYSRDIISIGHRNPQGLYYNKQENIILSTEHGPFGGDEINLNSHPDGDVENFGWPIASYGFKYGFDPETDVNLFKTSHQDYGFVEPLRYYTPSIAISQIIQLPKKFNNISQKQIFVAALTGSNPDPETGGKAITHFIMDDDYHIKQKDIFYLDSRIRDLIYVDTLNIVIAYHTDGKSILIIKAVNQ